MQKKQHRTNIISLSLLLFILITTALVAYYGVIQPSGLISFAQSKEIVPPVFPVDHAQHPSARSEWWYINLLVNTTSGSTDTRDLGYILSFSRINGGNALLSSRYDHSTTSFSQSTNTGGLLNGTVANNLLRVSYSHGTTSMILQELPSGPYNSKRFTLRGTTPQVGTFDLALRERTVGYTTTSTPLLWGCNGVISVFSTNDTAYYSMPNFDISGTIRDIHGIARTITAGKAWIDHQWFNTIPPTDWKGHYWLMNQVSGNSNIYDTTTPHQSFAYVTQVYTTGKKYTYWVRKRGNGSNQCGTTATNYIVSSGASGFPSIVNLKLSTSSTFANIHMYALSDNQKMSSVMGPSYVETISRVSGTVDGKSVWGMGIIETHLKNSSTQSFFSTPQSRLKL